MYTILLRRNISMANECYQNQESELAPLKVERVFDSCSDKDCFNDLIVTLDSGVVPPQYTMVKAKNVWVDCVNVNVEPLNFNKGFYSIDTTYTFRVELCCYERPNSQPVKLFGTTYSTKNCILYGSDVSTSTFDNNTVCSNSVDPSPCPCTNCSEDIVLPTATVQVAKPIVLDARIDSAYCHNGCGCDCGCDGDCGCGNGVSTMAGLPNPNAKNVYLTLGMFSVLELSRPVTVLVPTYEYTIPRKECQNLNESPCKAFEKINFPNDEFAPQTMPQSADGCGCGC
jgi:hypothetical protein